MELMDSMESNFDSNGTPYDRATESGLINHSSSALEKSGKQCQIHTQPFNDCQAVASPHDLCNSLHLGQRTGISIQLIEHEAATRLECNTRLLQA